MDDDGAFDVVVLGTGLTESIAAAALAKAGFKLAHIDRNPYYGAAEASLSFDELIQWQDTPNPGFSSFSRSGDTIEQARAYSISLSPSLIPSTGPLIDALVASGVAKYGGFRLIERVCVYDVSGAVKPVPGSKEDIFKNKEISLVDKRRLMRFLMFAAGEFEDKKELEGHTNTPFPDYLKTVFSLNVQMTNAIAYALAYCLSPTDPTLPALHRLRRYLRSTGRYGANPFLVGHYGSTGEIAQGFCRTAAVSGAVYILGREIEGVVPASDPKHIVRLVDFPDPLSCSLIISSASYSSLTRATPVVPPPSPSSPFSSSSPKYPVARCIAIIDRPLSLGDLTVPEAAAEKESAPTSDEAHAPPGAPPVLDTAVIVFPPSSLSDGSSTAAATVLLTGEGTMSCPRGKWILYIALPLPGLGEVPPDPRTSLKPYLDATLALASPTSDPGIPLKPLFSSFYIQQHPTDAPSPLRAEEPVVPALPHLTPASLPPVLALPDAGDAAAVQAEAVFWEAVRILRPSALQPDADEEVAITALWPAMEIREEGEDD
ncbi:FAD/NAD(P)-binding domain-containing protein [Mycena belliarum]|uniref:FAD/NAD(P)-binding domain-containing protein n=1 Tax=Mycena belliarum TaxID=1033014 RepID=A0AAD6TTQ4_9AGAR|nr:FAD/NAD(P)-binding domain-containing protein [Mycena belliae]